MHKTMKTKTLTVATMMVASFIAFAGLQKELQNKEDVLNTTPIVVDVTFTEEDPMFTNWVGSAEFRNIPRMTSEGYNTEYEPGKTNIGNRTKMFVGNNINTGDVVKTVKILDMYDVHDKLVIETPGSNVSVYKREYIDKVLSNKCDKVDLTSISPLTPSATTEEIVNAVKALATALGKDE